VLGRLLQERPERTIEYEDRLDEFRASGLPRLVSGQLASELARATLMFGLELGQSQAAHAAGVQRSTASAKAA
jgi:hypothetical protein